MILTIYSIFAELLIRMVKQLSHIILSILLLIATVGVTFNAHYCGGSMQKVEFSSVDHHCCNADMCGQCENHLVTYKINGDYLASANTFAGQDIPTFDLFGITSDLFYVNPFTNHDFSALTGNYMPHLHAPPPDPVITQSFRC